MDDYCESGYPVAPGVAITGEDIQQVLLAKSAVHSAIQLLVQEAGLTMKDIDHLYVAGGLGASASVWSAADIGLIPKELAAKYESVGNTALLGGIEYILHGDEEILNEIKEKSKVVILNDNPGFEKLFLENLMLN